MMVMQDWRESFESPEDRESFDQWLAELEAEQHAMEANPRKVVSNYTDCGRQAGSPYEGQG